jgi:hypothetical protein
MINIPCVDVVHRGSGRPFGYYPEAVFGAAKGTSRESGVVVL